VTHYDRCMAALRLRNVKSVKNVKTAYKPDPN
jgi:hypothetical protein